MDEDPTLEINFEDGIDKGIHALNLADHGIHLDPGIEYEWSVSLMVDPDNRSKDVFTRGLVMYIEDDAMAAPLTSQDEQSPYDLASQGLWYDALHAISNLVDTNPQMSSYHAQRAALLEQVDLTEAAAFDRTSTAN